MEVKIKNENRRSTMIIKKEISERGTLQEQMLLKNNINGIARLQLVFLNGEAYYRIDLKSYRSLKDIFDGKKMIYTDMCKFLKSLAEIISRLDDYLMKEEDLMLSPEYIFYDEQAMEYVFVYLPNLEENDGAEKLAEFLIEKADENDGDAVTLTSDYFNIVAEGGISPAEIIRNRKKSTEKTKSGKAKKPVRRAESRIRLPESGREIKMTDERNPDRENPVQKKNFITGIIICISLTLMAVGLYVAVLMNPYILTMIGLSEDDYMTAGVIIAVIFAAAIIGVIHFFKKKTEGGENGVNEITGIRENHSRYYEDYGMDYLDEAIERARYGNYDEAGEEDYEDDEYDEYEEYEKYEGREEDYYSERNNIAEDDFGEETVLLSDLRENQSFASLKGRFKGKELVFRIGEEPFLIGKMKGKVSGLIVDEGVSRIHACIRKKGQRYFINDLNSTNGTCLNERRLQPDENAEISDGDIVKFAHVTMRFSCNQSDKAVV